MRSRRLEGGEHLSGGPEGEKPTGCRNREIGPYDEAQTMHAPPAWRRLRLDAERREEAGHSTMKIRLGLISWATGTLMLAAVSACGGSDADLPDRRRRRRSVAESQPTTSASPTSPSDAATVAATDGGPELLHGGRPSSAAIRRADLKRLKIRRDEHATERRARLCIRREREQGLHQTGETKVVELTGPVGQPRQLRSPGRQGPDRADRCVLRRQRRRRTRRGRQVRRHPDRPDTGWIRYSVANYEWDSDPDGAWRVASSQDIERTPCDAPDSPSSSPHSRSRASSLIARQRRRRHGLPGHRPGNWRLPDLDRSPGESRRPGRSGRRRAEGHGVRAGLLLGRDGSGHQQAAAGAGALLDASTATGPTATTATSSWSIRSRLRAIRAGRDTSRAMAPSTGATSRRPTSSSTSGRRPAAELRRRPHPARGRADSRSSR